MPKRGKGRGAGRSTQYTRGTRHPPHRSLARCVSPHPPPTRAGVRAVLHQLQQRPGPPVLLLPVKRGAGVGWRRALFTARARRPSFLQRPLGRGAAAGGGGWLSNRGSALQGRGWGVRIASTSPPPLASFFSPLKTQLGTAFLVLPRGCLGSMKISDVMSDRLTTVDILACCCRVGGGGRRRHAAGKRPGAPALPPGMVRDLGRRTG